jgi:repressor of nif and glnA expression
MSQEEILEVLEKADKPLSRREIAELLEDTGLTKISATICKLLKNQEIKFIEVSRIEAKKKYNSKRRLRVYYI